MEEIDIVRVLVTCKIHHKRQRDPMDQEPISTCNHQYPTQDRKSLTRL
jgi:hypothetical protein